MEYLTVEEATDRLGLSRFQVVSLCNNKRLASRMAGKIYLIESKSVEALRRFLSDSITVQEAAAQIGCSPQAIGDRIKAGRLKAEKVGARRLISGDEWARFRALVELGKEKFYLQAGRPYPGSEEVRRSPEKSGHPSDSRASTPDVLILPDQVTEALATIATALKPHRGDGPVDGASMFSDIKAIRESLRKSDGKLGRLPGEMQQAIERGVAEASRQNVEAFREAVQSLVESVDRVSNVLEGIHHAVTRELKRFKGSPTQLVHDRMAGVETQMSLINGSLRSLGAKMEDIQS